MLEKLKEFDRTRLILGSVILITLPCYCLGMVMLWNANLVREQKTPTATFTLEGTKLTTLTPTYTVSVVSPTLTQTPTITSTFTPTITYVIPPTRTFTPSPSPPPTETLTPLPTFTNTPMPSPTFTPTEVTPEAVIPKNSP